MTLFEVFLFGILTGAILALIIAVYRQQKQIDYLENRSYRNSDYCE